MKICVIQLGDVKDCIVSSCLNLGFKQKFGNPSIDWVVSDGPQVEFLKRGQCVNSVINPQDLIGEYDILVNLTPSVHPNDPVLRFKESYGFNFDPKSSEIYDILYGSRRTNMNCFQVYFKLAGLKWDGSGYGFSHYPRTKKKKNTAGISIDHLKLRHYVEDRICLEGLKVSVLKYRKNVFKRIDDLNHYEHIVTDDLLTMHLAVYLRKDVHYLETIPLNVEPEFFGKGRIYRVPSDIVK